MQIKTIAFRELYQEYGKEIQKMVEDHHLQNGGVSREVKIKHYHNKFLNRNISDSDLSQLVKKFSDIVKSKVINAKEVTGALDFLEKYYKDIDLYLISGTPESELTEIVTAKKIDHFFKGIYGSPKLKEVKVLELLEYYTKDEVVFIGDSYTDYRASRNTNIDFIGRDFPGVKSIFSNDTKSYIKIFEEIEKYVIKNK